MNLLIYGAYGYTGELLVREAQGRGLEPILAGRREAPLRRLAEQTGLPHRVFTVESLAEAPEHLDGVDLVLNAAGPMVRTALPLARACIAAGIHYVDVTAELAALGQIERLHEDALEAGVTLLPAAGYDVVPSDCLAAHVTAELNDPTELEIVIMELPQPSAGTLRTVADMIGRRGQVRRSQVLVEAPIGRGARRFRFPSGERMGLPVPWGDLITAHRSTGVPNITVYLALRPSFQLLARIVGPLGPWLFRSALAQRVFALLLSRGRRGPDAALRASGEGWFLARARNATGETREACLSTPEGYRFTALAAIEIARRVQAGLAPAGMTTPAGAFGPELCLEIPGCRLISPWCVTSTHRFWLPALGDVRHSTFHTTMPDDRLGNRHIGGS